jgi:transcriptional antiterminator NusG
VSSVPEYDVETPVAEETPTAEPEEEFDPVAELRQKLRYAPGDWFVVHSY